MVSASLPLTKASRGRARTNARLPSILTQVERLVWDAAARAPAIMLMSVVRAARTLFLMTPSRILGRAMITRIPRITTAMSISIMVKPVRRVATIAPLSSIDPASRRPIPPVRRFHCRPHTRQQVAGTE